MTAAAAIECARTVVVVATVEPPTPHQLRIAAYALDELARATCTPGRAHASEALAVTAAWLQRVAQPSRLAQEGGDHGDRR